MKLLIRSIFVSILLLSIGATLQAEEYFNPDWGSLSAHNEVPEWFRDAKFGIYFHWGVYTVPAFGNEWYPRWMHFKGYKHKKIYDYHDFHLKNFYQHNAINKIASFARDGG